MTTTLARRRAASRYAALLPAVVAALAAASATPLHAQRRPAADTAKEEPGRRVTAAREAPRPTRAALPPSLVVFITVDQMIPDYFDRFGAQFTGGLRRLAQGGALFVNGQQDHATTETAPGHASTMSGRFPAHTGIVRNNAGVNDAESPLLDATGAGASPFRFRGTALIDWMRVKDPRTRALSVSRKDRGAILPLGRAHQEVYWYAPASGIFTTSVYYHDTLPTWIRAFNARREPQRYAGRDWRLLRDTLDYPEPDRVAIEADHQDIVFPHHLPADSARAAVMVQETPAMDSITLDLALAGLSAMDLGRGPAPDLLAVSLSSTDAVGHKYGPDSREMHDQILRLDRSLGAFLDSLYRVRDSSRIVVALTADHGMSPYPELHFAGKSAPGNGRADLAPLVATTRQSLASRGVDTAAIEFDFGMLFLDRARLGAAGVNADSVLTAFAAAARRVPGVLRADLVRDLARDSAKAGEEGAIPRRWLHALPPDLGVELVVTLLPYYYYQGVNYATHGSPHAQDARVPIVLYGPPFVPGRHTEFTRVVDIAPTLAAVLGVRPTEPLDGRVIPGAIR